MKWTSRQQQVIDSRERNLLVSAAAGSGRQRCWSSALSE